MSSPFNPTDPPEYEPTAGRQESPNPPPAQYPQYPQSPQYSQYPQVPQYNQAPLVSPYPGVGARFGALLLDYLVVGVVVVIIGTVLVWNDIATWIDELDRWSGNGTAPEPDLANFYLTGLIGLVLWFIYRVGLESSRGQTVGKMIMKMKVVDIDGRHPSIGSSLIRNVWYLFNTLAGLIPFVGWIANIGIPVAMAVTISGHPYRQSFTDRWAKTYVVSTR